MPTRLVTLVAACIAICVPGIAQSTAAQQGESSKAREFWNDRFRSGLPNVRKEPSRLIIEAIAEHPKPGNALDLGCGDGRNLLYLAAKGWTTTGVDISDVAIEQAKAAAKGGDLKAEFLVSDLDAFDLGKNKWDLLMSIFMQDWHIRSTTDTFARMKAAVKPGGLVVIEGFGPPNGLNIERIKQAFEGFTPLRADVVMDDPDWGKGRGNKNILRFVARKNPTAAP